MNKNFILLALTFFLWGNITAINSTLILFFFEYFTISWRQAITINILFYIAPFVTCLPCSGLISRYGYRAVLRGSLIITMIGCLGMTAALVNYSFLAALAAIFTVATGVASLQVVANPYLSLLSEPHRRVGNLSLASSINSMGTTLAPILIAVMLHYSPVDVAQHHEPVRWLWTGIAAFCLFILVLIWLVKLPDAPVHAAVRQPFSAVLKERKFLYSVGAIFLYVGVEVALATSLVKYLTTVSHWPMAKAVSSVALYWGGALIGRFLFGLFAHRLHVMRVFLVMTLGCAVLVVMAMLLANSIGGLLLLLTGLGNAILYPVIFSRSLQTLPQLANVAAAVLIMAGIGGAAIPWIQAFMIEASGVRMSFLLPVAIYLLLAGWGYMNRREERPGAVCPGLNNGD